MLEQLSCAAVYNCGAGGENARTIMARQGGDVMVVNNITIPADCTPVVIAERSTDEGIKTEEGGLAKPLLRGSDYHVNPCWIGDIEGTLSWTGFDHTDMNGTWTFTRNKPGNLLTIERPTALVTNFDRIHNESNEIMIIFMGANGGYGNIANLVEMHKKMIDHFKGKEYIILGMSIGNSLRMKGYESAMKEAFGRRFISLREYLTTPIYDSNNNIISCYGLADQGLEPDGDVTREEISNGIVPHQILRDSVHYTKETEVVIGKMLYRKMQELNILP